jgi:hypothetical protein
MPLFASTCRLGLDGEVPDHSTLSKNRHGRFRDCDLLRKLFETVARRCMAEGLVDGTAFAVDASLIAADANKQRAVAGSDDVDWEAIARTRRSVRAIHENARDVARDIARTEAYMTSRRERKKIEMLFAHLKRILRLDRLRLRGPFGARDEFLLAATAQNLRKLAKLIPLPTLQPA